MPQVIIERPARYSYISYEFAQQFVDVYDPTVPEFWDAVAVEYAKQNPGDPLPEDPPEN